MQVIEAGQRQKGTSEASRNARQVSRFLNELVQESGLDNLADGIPAASQWPAAAHGKQSAGKLRRPTISTGQSFGRSFRTMPSSARSWPSRKKRRTCRWCSFQGHQPADQGAIAGIVSEDYENDRALDDFSLLYTGATELPETSGSATARICAAGRQGPQPLRDPGAGWRGVVPNQYVYLRRRRSRTARQPRGRRRQVVLSLVDDFRHGSHAVWASAHATASRISPSTH